VEVLTITPNLLVLRYFNVDFLKDGIHMEHLNIYVNNKVCLLHWKRTSPGILECT
jgi:hypothetical protein